MVTDLRDQLQASLGDAYRLEGELGGGGMSRVFVADEDIRFLQGLDTPVEDKTVVSIIPAVAGG